MKYCAAKHCPSLHLLQNSCQIIQIFIKAHIQGFQIECSIHLSRHLKI